MPHRGIFTFVPLRIPYAHRKNQRKTPGIARAVRELTLPCRRLVQARSDALRQVIEPRACGAGDLPTKCRQKQKTTEMVVFVFGGA